MTATCHGLMQRCAEKGLNLNPEKSRIKESENKILRRDLQ